MSSDFSRPTESAHFLFRLAQQNNVAESKNMPDGLQNTLNFVIQGLDSLATALRATYIKLEEIERLTKTGTGRPF